MNIVWFSSHSILEYDEVRMFTDMGHDVFSIGAYEDPAHPGDDKRPAIVGAKAHPELSALCHEIRDRHGDSGLDYVIDWAKADLHPDIIEWADVIICPFFPEAWIAYQWDRISHKRVIWRTCGQSSPQTEYRMARYHEQGLEIVRYSPKERAAFEAFGAFAGEDAMIRFAKYPGDWFGWTGEEKVVGNVTQNMAARGDACGLGFWMEATRDLATKPAGPGSEALPGGVGALSYDAMRQYLRRIGAYLAMSTIPASYTLGFVEALMTGVPVISMGAARFGQPELFEQHELAIWHADNPEQARIDLERLLLDDEDAMHISQLGRQRAIELFGVETIAPQWERHLAGVPVAV